MGIDEEGTLTALRAVRRDLVDPKIAEHRGRIVRTMGDGLLVEFNSVVDAVRCAIRYPIGCRSRSRISASTEVKNIARVGPRRRTSCAVEHRLAKSRRAVDRPAAWA